jgi:hypothetical protein
MSHWGVARDVCAYLSHHDKIPAKPVIPQATFNVDKPSWILLSRLKMPKPVSAMLAFALLM